MSIETTSAAPLINLAIYCVTILTLAGIVFGLGRWLATTEGTSHPRGATEDTLSARPATWERVVRPRRRRAWGARRFIAKGASLFALPERREHREIGGISGTAQLFRAASHSQMPSDGTTMNSTAPPTPTPSFSAMDRSSSDSTES